MRTHILLAALTASVWAGSAAYSQNLFVTTGSNTVREYDTSGNVITGSYASGLYYPSGLAFDSDGNLFVADGDAQIMKVGPDGGASSLFVASNAGGALAFDSSGNLYAPNPGTGGDTISVFNRSGDLIQTISDPSLISPSGIAFDEGGNFYVSNNAAGTISKFDASGNLIDGAYVTGLNNPLGLAFDGAGNLYVADFATSTVSKYDSTGGLVNASFVSGLNSPYGLAFDNSGNLYVANSGNGTISKFASDGTTINTSLISGVNPTYIAFQDVPEPAAWTLLGAGTMALFGWRYAVSRLAPRTRSSLAQKTVKA